MRIVNPKSILLYINFLVIALTLASCSKSQSYSELLRDEEKATNWYMAQQEIVTEIPSDSIFITGKDAPFYKMDPDGYIYMQVVNAGNPENKAKKDELIYFRYMRTNIKDMYLGLDPIPSGNANNMLAASTSFRFKNTSLSSSTKFGAGVQLPLHYLGVDCEVNIVIRSYYGFTGETGQCLPYIYNLKYYRSQM